MKPLVSIVITLFNYEKYINDCLESCFRQTYTDTEIIVVDDCSTDQSMRIVHGFVSLKLLTGFMPNIRWILHDTNQGYAKAKNTGIRASNGEFVTFIDADDCLTVDSIEKRVEAFKPEIDFVHGNVYDVTTIGSKIATYDDMMDCRKEFSMSPGTLRYFTKQHRKKIHAQSQMFRRSVFERFGLYWDINSKADKEYLYRLGIHPLSPLPKLIKHKKIDDFVAFYRRHESSMKSGLKEKQKRELKDKFNRRIAQLKREGITKENTEWL